MTKESQENSYHPRLEDRLFPRGSARYYYRQIWRMNPILGATITILSPVIIACGIGTLLLNGVRRNITH